MQDEPNRNPKSKNSCNSTKANQADYKPSCLQALPVHTVKLVYRDPCELRPLLAPFVKSLHFTTTYHWHHSYFQYIYIYIYPSILRPPSMLDRIFGQNDWSSKCRDHCIKTTLGINKIGLYMQVQ